MPMKAMKVAKAATRKIATAKKKAMKAAKAATRKTATTKKAMPMKAMKAAMKAMEVATQKTATTNLKKAMPMKAAKFATRKMAATIDEEWLYINSRNVTELLARAWVDDDGKLMLKEFLRFNTVGANASHAANAANAG